jgi:hypothetical protein
LLIKTRQPPSSISPAKSDRPPPSFDDTVQDQWFTGSLIAPSPAFSKAGVFATEPYAIYTSDTGAYNSRWGHYSVPNNLNQLQSETLLKYSITDQLSGRPVRPVANRHGV